MTRHLTTMNVVLDTSESSVDRDRGPHSQREAARIWAAATAHRDGKPEPAPVESALPIIERGLRPTGSTLHLARLGPRPAGFAVVVPHEQGLEIVYLAVAPDAWGAGVASRLLLDVMNHASETSRSEVDLWVYDDNVRAVSVYRRAGWLETEDVRTHATSGRRERRFVKTIAERASKLDDD